MITIFRTVTNNDFSFLKRLYQSTRKQELEAINWDEKQKIEFMEFQFNAQHYHYINAYKGAEFNIITWNNKDIGRFYIWKTESQIRILDITLLPDYQGKGIGTKILNQFIKESEKSGKTLNLHVEYNNPALKLYKRLGFKKADDTGVYYFMERLPETKA